MFFTAFFLMHPQSLFSPYNESPCFMVRHGAHVETEVLTFCIFATGSADFDAVS
jgi:hypothetical protein